MAKHHIDDLPHQLAASACGIEATRKLVCLQQVATEVFIGFIFGARGGLEEVGQGLLGDELGLGIDRITEDLERDAAPQDLLACGGIDGHGGARIIQELRQFAAAHEMHAFAHAVEFGQPLDLAAYGDAASSRGCALTIR